MNRTLRSISRNDTETDDLPENVRYLKPPTYQQFDRFKNDFVDDSSTPYWVSPVYESININFQVNAGFGGKKPATNCLPIPILIYVKLSSSSVEIFILKELL